MYVGSIVDSRATLYRPGNVADNKVEQGNAFEYTALPKIILTIGTSMSVGDTYWRRYSDDTSRQPWEVPLGKL